MPPRKRARAEDKTATRMEKLSCCMEDCENPVIDSEPFCLEHISMPTHSRLHDFMLSTHTLSRAMVNAFIVEEGIRNLTDMYSSAHVKWDAQDFQKLWIRIGKLEEALRAGREKVHKRMMEAVHSLENISTEPVPSKKPTIFLVEKTLPRLEPLPKQEPLPSPLSWCSWAS